MVAVPIAQASTIYPSISVSKVCLRVNFDHVSRPAKKSYPYRPQSNAMASCHLLCSSSIHILSALASHCKFYYFGDLIRKAWCFFAHHNRRKANKQKNSQLQGGAGCTRVSHCSLTFCKVISFTGCICPKNILMMGEMEK